MAGGIVGGLIGGAFGIEASRAGFGLIKDVFQETFLAGFAVGAIELGVSGFGAGFGETLGSGGSLSSALISGAYGATIGGTIGGFIEGSYLAGWQDIAHCQSKFELGIDAFEGALQVKDYYDLGKKAEDSWNLYNRKWYAYFLEAVAETNDKTLLRSLSQLAKRHNLFPAPDVLRGSLGDIKRFNKMTNNWLKVSDNLSARKYDLFDTVRRKTLLDERRYHGFLRERTLRNFR